MTDSKKIVLLDGSSFIYRAFFAAKQDFRNSKGIPTGAVLFFAKMLRNLLSKKYHDACIVVVFDAKGKNFRHEMYPEYKATRAAMPDDLIAQIPYIHDLVKAMGLPIIEVPGVEADDVLGSYAKAADKRGFSVTICTGDKDLAQLVDDNVTLFDAMNNIVYDREHVIAKFGVGPELIIDLLALKGDTADNIPGMTGTGDKTALALLQNIGGVYTIKEHLPEIASLKFRGSKTFADRFLEQWDQIELSYKLATIKTDLELPRSLDELLALEEEEDDDALLKLFTEMEFKALVKEQKFHKVQKDAVPRKVSANNETHASQTEEKKETPAFTLEAQIAPQEIEEEQERSGAFTAFGNATYLHFKKGYHLVRTKDELDTLCSALKKAPFFSAYAVTTEDRPSDCSILGLSFCHDRKNAYYLPLFNNRIDFVSEISTDDVLASIKEIFENPDYHKVAHDIKALRLVLHFALNINLNGIIGDPMLMAHTLETTQRTDLPSLMSRHLDYEAIHPYAFLEKKVPIAEQDIEKLQDLACEQAHMSFCLYQYLLPQIEAFPKGLQILEHDIKALDALYEMEKTGSYLDTVSLNKLSSELKKALASTQEQIFAETGEVFNIASVPQLTNMLFEKLAIPYPKKNVKTGKNGKKAYSSAAEILTLLEDDYPIVKLILRYRFLSKLISTYTDKLPKLISPKTGRIHTCFNLAGTTTGRLSSSDPNLQNIPSRTEEGRKIRSCFTAPKGYKIVAADYSQIELRLIADIANDTNLRAAFQHHKDIHRATAAALLGKPIEDVTDLERAQAKSTNFGLIYGISSHGLAKQTGLSMRDAQAYINSYFAKYPSIQTYMTDIVKEARAQGYVTTLDGRHVNIAGINVSGPARRQAERAAINAPMQGSAADIIRKAMVVVLEYMRTLDPEAVRMTLQVHDELVFEVRDDIVDEFSKKVKELMEGVTTLSIPLEVGVGVADNWGDAH